MRERLSEWVRNYFIIVTLIDVAMLVLGKFFAPGQVFGYEIFIYPLIYGLVGSIPGLILVFTGKSDREPSVRQYIVRQALSVLVIVAVLLTIMFAGQPVNAHNVTMAAGVAVSVLVVFAAVNAITWLIDSKTARAMTSDLKSFQERNASL
ncbi:MAG: hypothetical protein IJ757_08840 [Clostridiales bacterium]|nr:hypothetical protein [Clostridiales bacterium]